MSDHFGTLCIKGLRNSSSQDYTIHILFVTGIYIEDFFTCKKYTAWKVSKCVVISGPNFPIFSPNAGKYGPEITPYLDTFHAVTTTRNL